MYAINNLYVSPAGHDDAPGTLEHPFATLGRAHRAALEAGTDVTVHLRAGTYPPAELTSHAGHRITYQPYEGEQAVISGGRRITGWREEDGVWVADVGDLDTRHLRVGGRGAERASIPALPGQARMTATGYVTDVQVGWHSPADVEFVHRGVYPWTEARCAVAAVSEDGRTITMAQPAFGWAMKLYDFAWEGQRNTGPGLPTSIENDATFLTEPGTFVLDRSRPGHHLLRYLPRPGERPEDVVAPAAETLLRATGLRGVHLRGLTFADSTWLRPGSPEGFLHYHGTGYYDGGPVQQVVIVEGQAWVTVPAESATIPAGVTFEDCEDVTIEDCRFTHLGATALGLTGGSGLTVRGCAFDAPAAAAVTVTGSRDTRVEDNVVAGAGTGHSGSPGISIIGTDGCAITHNRISDVPHCGIAAGPGRGTRIEANLVTGAMSVLADGGGIYLSGPQGDSAGSGALVRGNVITDTRTPYHFALYTDYGAAWVTVEGNVVARADNTAVLHVSPPLEHVVYRGNIWDADPVGADSVPDGVTYEDNITIGDERELEAATVAIRAQAGPRRR